MVSRCTDKILSQLEMQANLCANLNEAQLPLQPSKPSIKSYSDQVINPSIIITFLKFQY